MKFSKIISSKIISIIYIVPSESSGQLLRLQEYLGSGRFGIVYRGLLTVSGGDSEGGVKEVAVKTMENGASEEDRVKFLQEAAIMGQFNNPYIVKIYGVLMSSQPVRNLLQDVSFVIIIP